MITSLILLPIVAAIACYAFPKDRTQEVKWFGVAVAALTVAGTIAFRGQADESVRWLSRPFDAFYHVAIGSGVSFWMALLLTVVTFSALVATRAPNQRHFVAQLLLLEGTMLGLFLARDVLLFALFWDAMLLPVFLLLIEVAAAHTAWRYLIYNLSAGLALLLATAAYGYVYGSTDVIGRVGLGPVGGTWGVWIFSGFAFAFLVKTPVWPFHTWMPDTYADAPSPLAAVISAVQSKGGLYGFLVIALPLFPDAAHAAVAYLFPLGMIGLIYGALVALVQDDVKRIVAYSSLSHLGLILIALFSFNALATAGAVVYMVAHGLFSAAMFLTLGFIEQREETRALQRLGGLSQRNPRLSGGLHIAALAMLGLPGLAGFAGELLIVIGLFAAGALWPAIVALVAIVLASAYTLRLFQGAMQGPQIDDLPQRPDLTWLEGAALAPLVLSLVMLGVDPQPIVATTAQAGFSAAAAATGGAIK